MAIDQGEGIGRTAQGAAPEASVSDVRPEGSGSAQESAPPAPDALGAAAELLAAAASANPPDPVAPAPQEGDVPADAAPGPGSPGEAAPDPNPEPTPDAALPEPASLPGEEGAVAPDEPANPAHEASAAPELSTPAAEIVGSDGAPAEAADGEAPRRKRRTAKASAVEGAPAVAPEAAPAAPESEPAQAAGAAEATPLSPTAAFRIALPNFEGPLDLLLHLIREHKVDIFDIPISLITEKYLDAIKAMKEMDLDIAGEFILMAATLAHIKSRLLLPNPEPVPDEDEPQVDPREELVRRLLEYQKYRAAAEELARQDLLDREVFTRRARLEQIPLTDGEVGLVEVSIFKLVESLAAILKNAKPQLQHHVVVDRISLSETINQMIELLKHEPRTSLFTVLQGVVDRQRIVYTFLALLEMAKMRLIRVYQEEDCGDIMISARDPELLKVPEADFKDEYK